MKNVYVFLGDGFEEIEAITPIDFLRRAGVAVHTVSIHGQQAVGSHGIQVQTDTAGEGFVLPADADMVMFPGGPGVDALRTNACVKAVLAQAAERGIYVAAICAAPRLLQDAGLLQGKRVTAFPTTQGEFDGALFTGAPVETDGNIITSRSAGTALAFAHALAEALLGKDEADAVLQSLYP